MAYFTPAELPENRYYLFGKNGGKKLADEFEVPFLGEIPIVQSIREAGDKGMPVALSDDAVSRKAFYHLSTEVERQIAIINANQLSDITVETVS
jgi:ATP-binding protein involved in chromosome partitioning